MSKKKYLELLIKTFGLIPKDIKTYRTSSCGGQYEISVGWEGKGYDDNNVSIIDFATPEGFKDAVYEIIKQAQDNDCKLIHIFL